MCSPLCQAEEPQPLSDIRKVRQRGDLISEPFHASSVVREIWSEACSSADRDAARERFREFARNPVYVTYSVRADRSDLEDNVNAHLQGLVPIKRYAFRREEKTIRAKVLEAVQVFGFYSPEITVEPEDPEDYHNPVIRVSVKRGDPVLIENLDVDYGIDGEVLEEVKAMETSGKMKPGNVFSHVEYENFKTAVLSTMLSRGYVKARITTSQVYVYREEKRADVKIVIQPGIRHRIGSIVYEGFEESHPVAKKMNRIKEGDYYDAQKNADLSQSLYQSGYFQSADVKVDDNLATEDGKLPMVITLAPRPSTIVDVGIGFSTDEGPRLQLAEKTPWINDLGHSFNSTSKLSLKDSFFRGNYVIPRDDPNNDFYQISPSYEHKDNNDTLYDSFVISAHYITRIHGTWEKDIFIEYGYDDFVQGDDKGWSSLLMPGITLSRTGMQKSIDPSWGYRVSITAKASLENIVSRKQILYTDVILKALMSPTENSRLLLRFQQGAVMFGTLNVIPPRLRFFTGGDNTVRGYGYEQISPRDSTGRLMGGRFMTVGSAELQLPVAESMRVATFLDMGMVTNSYSKERDIKVGTGMGIRYISPVGPIRLDLGLGIKEKHIPFRIHFGIGNGL